MLLSEMSKDERSLLLFLETCAVDNGGLIDVRHMNDDDFSIADDWQDKGIIEWGRLSFADVEKYGKNRSPYSRYVIMSQQAFNLAHQERIERSIRMLKKRTWKKAGE